MLETALDRFGRVDILVNNAGVSMAKTLKGERRGLGVRFQLEGLGRRTLHPGGYTGNADWRGRIINVTNLVAGPWCWVHAHLHLKGCSGIAITKGLSRDLAKDNILVTTVCIGLIKSGQHERRYAA